jgi:hypothetical protein
MQRFGRWREDLNEKMRGVGESQNATFSAGDLNVDSPNHAFIVVEVLVADRGAANENACHVFFVSRHPNSGDASTLSTVLL